MDKKLFGRWIKKRRAEENMTLQQVADGAMTTKSYVHDVENGVSEPSLSKAAMFAGAFGLSLCEALKDIDNISS